MFKGWLRDGLRAVENVGGGSGGFKMANRPVTKISPRIISVIPLLNGGKPDVHG